MITTYNASSGQVLAAAMGGAGHFWNVSSNRPTSYCVVEKYGFFESQTPFDFCVGGDRPERAFIVIDRNVEQLYGNLIRSYFNAMKMHFDVLVLDGDESNKTADAAFKVARTLEHFKLARRREPIIAIGGGVVMDIVGFAASIYRRGTPFYRVPTTLMGQIDAGIGIKTGVNFDLHKNRLGSYYPAALTVIDRRFLQTQDDRHIRNGISEIVKMALIKDKRLFDLLMRQASGLVQGRFVTNISEEEIFKRAIQGMLEELSGNLWEELLERSVDFGHTFSPILEMDALPELLHGEAVSIDMAISLALSFNRGLIGHDEFIKSIHLFERLGLPVTHQLCTPEYLMVGVEDATRHRDGLLRLPLPAPIGSVQFIHDISIEELSEALSILSHSTRARATAEELTDA